MLEVKTRGFGYPWSNEFPTEDVQNWLNELDQDRIVSISHSIQFIRTIPNTITVMVVLRGKDES